MIKRVSPSCLATTTLVVSLAMNTPALAQPVPTTPAATVNPGTAPGAALGADALPAQRFSLDAALGLMQQTHPLLASAQSTVRAASADVTAAGLWTNPQVSLSYSRAIGPTSFDPTLGFTALTASQLLETAGLPTARRRVAEALYAASRADAEGVRLSLVYAVRSAFVALAAAYARQEVLVESTARLEIANRVVNDRVAAGAAPHYDASRIGLAVADARAAVTEAAADVVAARVTFDVAVGPRARELQGVPDVDMVTPAGLPSLATLMDQMVHQRPDLMSAHHRAVSAGAQIDVARRTVFQGITLSAGASLGQSVTDNTPEVDVTLGVGFPLPFVDRGQGTIPAAQFRAESAARQYDAVVLAAQQELSGFYETAQRRQEAATRYATTGVGGSVGMRTEAEIGYREGRLQILDLVDAYASYRDARLRLLNLAAAARSAEVDLRRAVEAPPSGNGP